MSTAIESVTHLPAGSGRSFGLMGSSVTFKLEPDGRAGAGGGASGATGGTPMVFEHRMPATLGVPPHTEENQEAFYVLEGVLEVQAEGRRYRLTPGDFLRIAPGVEHSLHNPGPGDMRVLTLVDPGHRHARFFSTLGTPIVDPARPPAPEASPDVERVMTVAEECGIHFLPPPDA